MQKILALGLYILVFLSLSSVAHAQQNPRTVKKKIVKSSPIIRDAKKKEIVNKIDERLNALNKLLVEKLTAHVDRLELILNKLEDQANQLELAGKNTSEIKSSITASRTRIKEFKDKLLAQSEKTYTPQITTETNLRLNVGESHQALQEDLKELREELISLKNEVLQIVVLIIKLTPKLTITPTT